MAVQYLTSDWAKKAQDALNGSDAFKTAIGSVQLTVQQNVTGGPLGDIGYFLKLDTGEAKMQIGQVGDADVTITQDYDTAVAIARGELNAQNAFMTGKLKVSGNIAKLMQHQAAFSGLENALKPLQEETTY
jgi:SCP-2 sterol transfer family protein